MKFYFTTRQIPGLEGLGLVERLQLLDRAAKRLSVPEKTTLNILKLLIIVPAFALILRVTSDWTFLLWAVAVFLLYPLLVKPIQYSISAKYIARLKDKESQ